MEIPRLNQYIDILDYTLHIVPNLAFEKGSPNSFTIAEKIDMKVTGQTNKIKLNKKGLTVENVELKAGGKTYHLSDADIEEDKKGDTITFNLPEYIKEGDAQLSLIATGILSSDLTGFYLSSHNGRDGSKRYIGTTQMEPDYARQAFICEDTPSAKATFDISMVIEDKPGYKALSNMGLREEISVGNGRKIVKFKTTPKMSTYLVYFGAGEFDSIQLNSDGININLYASPGKAKYGKFALDAAKEFLKFYEEYFDFKYPLDKLDLIAIPDFGAGAMENWGAITFRESALLFNPDESDLVNKQRIAQVVAHELVHQWFGNLVTPKWWNDTWLNESFADFLAQKAVASKYPELNPWGFYLHNRIASAFDLDSMDSSHPIEMPVRTPGEIKEVFDAISYSKGGTCLLMLEHYLGKPEGNDPFRDGLRRFLKDHAYGCAEGIDLWNALETASGQPVPDYMKDWISKKNHPIVSVKIEGYTLTLEQKLFQYLLTDDKEITWKIPMKIKIDGREFDYLFDKKKVTIDLSQGPFNLKSTPKIIDINSEHKGFYRSRYEDKYLDVLEKAVSQKKLTANERWGLNEDLAALCLKGEISLTRYLTFIQSYRDETDYLVLMGVFKSLEKLTAISLGKPYYNNIANSSRTLYNNVLKRVGWTHEEGTNAVETDKTIRSRVINNLGELGDAAVLSRVDKLFKDSFPPRSVTIDPELRTVVYSLVAKRGDLRTFDTLHEMYAKTNDAQEKERLLAALANFSDKGLLEKTLDLSLSEEVRMQDLIVLFRAMSVNPHGWNLVGPWVEDNWLLLRQKYEKTLSGLNVILNGLSMMDSIKDIERVVSRIKEHPLSGTEMTLNQLVERRKVFNQFVSHAESEFSN